MAYGGPQILPPHSYYHNPRSVLHPDNGLVSSMASCQRFSSSLPNHDARFQHQSPTIVYSRGGRSLSDSPGSWQTVGVMTDPHRSVLAHTGPPVQSVGPISPPQHSSIIQFSPTNHHLLRSGDAPTLPPPQPDNQQMIYCDGYSPQPSPHSPTHPQSHPEHCPTVIQQTDRTPSGTRQMEASGGVQRRVTIKEENLDQAYLDDVNEIIRKDLTGVQARGQT
uniref:Nuclear factor of activated T-cells, cytoplasmic, calcineurin-dependent 2 n=1 Tax=Nothobranchius rachovii TaxID=451742 RepID=A0A1A8N655_9TELE